MRVLVVADELAGFKIHKDSTYAMLRELARRGHEIATCLASQLSVDAGVVLAQASPMSFASEQVYRAWFVSGDAQRVPLTDFDAVLMRTDPPFDQQYYYATQLFSLAEQQGARVFNRGQALRDFNEKLAILRFPEFIAPTLVSQDLAQIRGFVAEQGEVILKPLDGMGGAGIFRVRLDEPNLGSILELLTEHGQRTIMAQRYLPQIVEGDKRVLLIAGKPVDWCLARIPQGFETRGNLAAGGRGEARPLSARDREIAEALGPQLAAQGLLLVGLDVIGDSLTEVNVTSPTCFQEISAQSGIAVAALFVDALEHQCA